MPQPALAMIGALTGAWNAQWPPQSVLALAALACSLPAPIESVVKAGDGTPTPQAALTPGTTS